MMFSDSVEAAKYYGKEYLKHSQKKLGRAKKDDK